MKRLLLAVVVSAGCWTGTVAEPNPEPVASSEPKAFKIDLELELERTPCFGMCPIFAIHIYPDGRMHWFGRDNVAVRGEKTKRLTLAQMKQLEQLVKRSGILSVKPDAPTCVPQPNGGTSCSWPDITICSDTSHSVITVRTSHAQAIVDNAHCGDESPNDNLEHAIEGLAAKWIGR
ncbi:MAG: DUF6438 domain-containing protein [Kofleriaceae bacterium]